MDPSQALSVQTTEWGLNMMTTGAQTLREAERKARQGRVAMWANYVPRPDAPTKLHDEFAGTVTEVGRAAHRLPILDPSAAGAGSPSRKNAGLQTMASVHSALPNNWVWAD